MPLYAFGHGNKLIRNCKLNHLCGGNKSWSKSFNVIDWMNGQICASLACTCTPYNSDEPIISYNRLSIFESKTMLLIDYFLYNQLIEILKNYDHSS